SPDISISTGDYTYLTYGFNASSGQASSTFSVDANFNNGEFWDGRRTAMGGGFNWTPNAHFGANLTYDRNRVRLPLDRSFTTQLIGSRFSYAVNPRAFLNAFIQYNADTRQ